MSALVDSEGQIFEPLKFVYTETIGSLSDKLNELSDPYIWSYQDILQPRPVPSQNLHPYTYLFHIAPIYNWLRKAQSSILEKYLETSGPNPPTKQPKHSNTTSSLLEEFKKALSSYIEQWEVVKLCASAKVKVTSTRAKGSLIECVHLIQTQFYTTGYHFSEREARFRCDEAHCEECGKDLKVEAEILSEPFAPILKEFHGREFEVSKGGSAEKFEITIIGGKDQVYVRSASGAWYSVTDASSRVVAFNQINVKAMGVFVYQKKSNKLDSDKVLMKAVPFHLTKSHKQMQRPSKKLEHHEDRQTFSQMLTEGSENRKSIKKQLPDLSQEQQVLEEICKTHLPIVMNKKKTDRKLFKEYKRTVEALEPKPKQKDQYQKDYDKGKTKKIHKNKQKQFKADFFDLYKSKFKQNCSNSIEKELSSLPDYDQQAFVDKKQKKKALSLNSATGEEGEDFIFSNRYIKKSRGRFKNVKFLKSKKGNKGRITPKEKFKP